MPYSTACSTALSNFEAGQNYKDVSDPAVVVSFPLDGDEGGWPFCYSSSSSSLCLRSLNKLGLCFR
jgi:isoleucyl-tRNA synthetase